jgi:hypothetical protein
MVHKSRLKIVSMTTVFTDLARDLVDDNIWGLENLVNDNIWLPAAYVDTLEEVDISAIAAADMNCPHCWLPFGMCQ